MKVLEVNFKDGINAKAHRKENGFMEELLGCIVVDGTVKVVVNCRTYGTKNKNYCCLWYNNGEKYGSGSGSAGGWGYHRPSAAMQEALDTSGVLLSKRIDAYGDSAMREAVMLLTKKLYPRKKVTVLRSNP